MELLFKEVESAIARIEGSTCEDLMGRRVVSDKKRRDRRENKIGRRGRRDRSERSEQREEREENKTLGQA